MQGYADKLLKLRAEQMRHAATWFLLLPLAVPIHALRCASTPRNLRQRGRVVLQEVPDPPEAAEPAAELSYIEEQKLKFSGTSDATPATRDVTIATPAFFGKREDERPGDALGERGLNEQGYDPYDPEALDSSAIDTKPVFAALALALVAAVGISAKTQIGF